MFVEAKIILKFKFRMCSYYFELFILMHYDIIYTCFVTKLPYMCSHLHSVSIGLDVHNKPL
jgi:hypothetical protein